MSLNPGLAPSEYTAALISVLRDNRALVQGASALEIGIGSGVVLAALGKLGAASLEGVDIELTAVKAARRLLGRLGFNEITKLHKGDMWKPLRERRFDLIVANLPSLPTKEPLPSGRYAAWSYGGPNGRMVLDPFLHELSDHLTPDGNAFIPHAGFLDMDRTRTIAEEHGLSLEVASKTMFCAPQEKLNRMTPEVVTAQTDVSMHFFGPFAFVDTYILRFCRVLKLG
jgi:release factor glutamine methyltransferase